MHSPNRERKNPPKRIHTMETCPLYMDSQVDDSFGVFDGYTEEQREKLREAMHEPLLDAKTEWVETDAGKRLRMVCPECDEVHLSETRPGTARCESCMRIMQAADYEVDPRSPDPENPEWYLEKIAKRRGNHPDEYKEEAEPQSALSW